MSLPTWMLRPHASGRYGALRVGLVAYWPLEEDAPSGDVTAVDFTGRGNNLTSNNSVPSVTGKVGTARQFVAANTEYLSRASNADLQFGNANWSIALWIQPRATGTADQRAIGKDVSGGREFTLNCSLNTTTNANVFAAVLFNTSNNLSLVVAEPSDTPNADFVNKWFHVAVVHNGGLITVYRNGVSRASGTRPSGQTFNAAGADFNIGRRSFAGFNEPLDGYVDEVAKWNRALSAAEISALWNNGNGIDLRR